MIGYCRFSKNAMETVNDRMQKIVDECFGGKKATFAKAIGMVPTSISSYLGTERRSKPSIDILASIVENLDIEARWLLTGKGSMYSTERYGNCCGDGSMQVPGNHNNLSVIQGKALIQEQEANAELRRLLVDAQVANARLIALLEKFSIK